MMKILVYVEPGPRGDWALALGEDLARGAGAAVILLTTLENQQLAPRLLDEAAERFSAIPGLAIEKKARPGPARDAILVESRESFPAITVFPPAGRRGLLRLIKGSRVKSVVHNAPSTVMVARRPVSDHIHRILVTVSGGPFSETTLLSAQEIARSLQAELTLLHVTSGIAIPYGPPEPSREGPEAHPERIERLLASLENGGSRPRVRLRQGMVVHEILAECEEGHFDLLILGQHLADKEAGGQLSENIAELLAVECPIPVLIVRPRRWAAGKLESST
jgi:nucleotide-binding universal stress UspA family protein